MQSSRVCPASQTPESGISPAGARSNSCRRHTAGHRRRALLFIAAVSLVAAVAFAAPAAAGSWTLPGETGLFDFNTTRQETDSAAQFALKPRVEYGLTDDLTLGLNNEYKFVKSDLDTDYGSRTAGFVNTELFLRGRLRDQDWYKISAQDIVHLPGEESESGFSHGAASLGLQYGRTGRFAGGSWTSSIKNGFQPSLDDMPDRLQTDLSLGWRPDKSWQFTAQSLNSLVFESEDGADTGDISRAQLSVVRFLNKSLSVQLSGWETLAGDPSNGASGFDALVWLRY